METINNSERQGLQPFSKCSYQLAQNYKVGITTIIYIKKTKIMEIFMGGQ